MAAMMTSTDEPASDKKPAHKKSRLRLAVVIAVLLLLLAVVGWQFAREWLRPVEPVAVSEAPSLAVLRTFEKRLAALESRIAGLEKLAAAENSAARVIESSQTWWLSEVERYLAEASERLNPGADTRGALSALKSAANTLRSVSVEGAFATRVDTIREILHIEIQLLEGYRNHAAMQAMVMIDNILERLESGVAVTEKPPEVTGVAVSEPPVVAWGDLLERFKRLVVIEVGAGGGLQQANKELAMYSLMLARAAIFGEDSRSYRYAIAGAKKLLAQAGVSDRAIDDDLQALQSLDIAPVPPHIGKALEEMRVFIGEMQP